MQNRKIPKKKIKLSQQILVRSYSLGLLESIESAWGGGGVGVGVCDM